MAWRKCCNAIDHILFFDFVVITFYSQPIELEHYRLSDGGQPAEKMMLFFFIIYSSLVR